MCSRWRSFFVLVLNLVVACGDSSGGDDPTRDAGGDAGTVVTDGGSDASVEDADDGSDASVDETDGGSDASDGGTDATDASVDPVDAWVLTCVAGTVRCGAGNTVETCDAGLAWVVGETCPFLCDAGACAGVCLPGATRCGSGNVVETCNANGAFAVTATCAQGCASGACTCGSDYELAGNDCVPRDFCALPRGGCAPDATCSQTGVVPTCTCDEGLTGNGLVCSQVTKPIDEHFENVAGLAAAGWTIRNSSSPLGSNSWYEGPPSPTLFDAYDGPTNSYMAANYNSTTTGGTISTWLVTPEIDFGDHAKLVFYTRTTAASPYPDRLHVTLCPVLPCEPPTNTGVGDFTMPLIHINQSLGYSVYPGTWTRYEATNANGIPYSGRGRIGFRYFVTNGGPNGTNSNAIGLDAVSYEVGQPSYPVRVDVRMDGGWADLTISVNRVLSLPITYADRYEFPTRFSLGTPYAVTVTSPPAGGSCEVVDGVGTVVDSNAFVRVNCTTP